MGLESVILRSDSSGERMSVDISQNMTVFKNASELWDYDYILMKNVIENISESNNDCILFSGNTVNAHYYSRINITENEVYNCPGVSEILTSKGIKFIHFRHGDFRNNIDMKKEFFNLGKKFPDTASQNSDIRSCRGCPIHCFSFITRAGKQNIRYKVYKRYFSLAKDMLSEDFIEDMEKFFYLLEVFSVDPVSIIPVIKIIRERKELFSLIGIDDRKKFEFRDIVTFLKNLNSENNDFFNLLRSDNTIFEREYGFSLRKERFIASDYAMTSEEKKLFHLDFYPSNVFEYTFTDIRGFLKHKALFEYFGICPNCIDIYDEYWISKIGEKIDTQFSSIDRMNTLGEIFFRYKHETEKTFTGMNRIESGGKDE